VVADPNERAGRIVQPREGAPEPADARLLRPYPREVGAVLGGTGSAEGRIVVVPRHGVEVRGRDVAAAVADVVPAPIVRHDEHDVGPIEGTRLLAAIDPDQR
jgi:hypothetical protein